MRWAPSSSPARPAHAIEEYRRLFRDYGGFFGYGCIVGRKP